MGSAARDTTTDLAKKLAVVRAAVATLDDDDSKKKVIQEFVDRVGGRRCSPPTTRSD